MVDSDDRAVLDKLEAAVQAMEFERHAFWKETVQPALELAVLRCQESLETIDPSKVAEVIRAQEQIKLYRHFVTNLIAVIKQNGVLAHEEASDRGLLTLTTGERHG